MNTSNLFRLDIQKKSYPSLMEETEVKTSMKSCLISCISIQPPSSTAEHFILILIHILTAGDNHIPTEEIERFQEIFE